jgi:hypothetical protein
MQLIVRFLQLPKAEISLSCNTQQENGEDNDYPATDRSRHCKGLGFQA